MRRNGQTAQRGSPGTQTSAPSSISAWLNSPQCRAGNRAAANAQSFCCVAGKVTFAVMPNTRANRRATLPSTTGSRSSKAMLAIAPAV